MLYSYQMNKQSNYVRKNVEFPKIKFRVSSAEIAFSKPSLIIIRLNVTFGKKDVECRVYMANRTRTLINSWF